MGNMENIGKYIFKAGIQGPAAQPVKVMQAWEISNKTSFEAQQWELLHRRRDDVWLEQ